MKNSSKGEIEDALNSMLRTDYIPLRDTDKLRRLSRYYIDYFGYLKQIVGESDQLIVGRRGTGKTTLLYRALIECIDSWSEDHGSAAKEKTLGIYLDLSKCHSLNDTSSDNYDGFERVFVSELIDTVREELIRNWPQIEEKPNLIEKIFSQGEVKKRESSSAALDELSKIVLEGIPREIQSNAPNKFRKKLNRSSQVTAAGQVGVSDSGVAVGLGATSSEGLTTEIEVESTQNIVSLLTVSDLLRRLGQLREACSISHIVVLVDEFSALSVDLQRRFCTLLRKVLGNHAGVYIKISAITDNFSLGSSIILQRDLFELSLDLDAFVDRSGTLNSAMSSLAELTEELVCERIQEYAQISANDLFESPKEAWTDLSRSAMGVPRTIGIALKQAFYRSEQSGKTNKIRRSDIDYGIKYAARAYQSQFLGACGVAIPSYCEDILSSLLDRAIEERAKFPAATSHFMVLPKNEEKLRYLNMFFIIHLVTKGRTTKKEKASRSLYAFDYGVCLENNLDYGTDKNVIRQQRFAYDEALNEFDQYFERTYERRFQCKSCSSVYKETDLFVGGQLLTFCPKDKADLSEVPQADSMTGIYTEEEMKIIGAIRSSDEEDRLLARQVADDVGCYVQKVAKFGERLERDQIIKRRLEEDVGRNIYFGTEKGADV